MTKQSGDLQTDLVGSVRVGGGGIAGMRGGVGVAV